MGTMFIAKCSCGYEARPVYRLPDDGKGPIDAAVPVVCLACKAVFAADVRDPAAVRCSACGSDDVLPTLRVCGEPQSRQAVTHFIEGTFPCPACNRWTLEVGAGQWD